MNQDDFRKLLDSGGDGAGGRKSGVYGGKRNLTSLDLDSIRKLSAKKMGKKTSGKPHREREEQEDAREAAATTTQYRDRAAERRQGILTDDVDIEELKRLSGVGKSEDAAKVKAAPGLDLSLLSQLKQEKERLQRAAAAEKVKRDASATVNELFSEVDLDKEPTFQTRLGRMVYLLACPSQSQTKTTDLPKSELFLPGRMYYTFSLAAENSESIPTAVQRSKEDCPDPDDIISGSIDDDTIDDVRRALEQKLSTKKLHHRQDESKSSRAHAIEPSAESDAASTEVEPTTNSAENDDDDMDIFPDAGEYVPAYLREDRNDVAGDKIGTQGYFENLSASLTEAEREAKRREQEAEDAWKETVKKAVEAQLEAERLEALKARAAKLAAAQDSYDDYEFGHGGDDSDEDEESGSKKRKGAADDAKKVGSKAAVGEEEMARRKKQRQGNKLENDLKKITKLIHSKEE